MFLVVPYGTHALITSQMFSACVHQLHCKKFEPHPAMFSRCFRQFPGPLAPSVYTFNITFVVASKDEDPKSSRRRHAYIHLFNSTCEDKEEASPPRPPTNERLEDFMRKRGENPKNSDQSTPCATSAGNLMIVPDHRIIFT